MIGKRLEEACGDAAPFMFLDLSDDSMGMFICVNLVGCTFMVCAFSTLSYCNKNIYP